MFVLTDFEFAVARFVKMNGFNNVWSNVGFVFIFVFDDVNVFFIFAFSHCKSVTETNGFFFF